jgi:membrane protein DedA with SNARE-associated domain
MTDQLLELLTTYGLPALFGAMILAAAGMPFPSSLTLVAMGSFVAQGELSFWPVVFAGASGAIVGDQISYAFGRYGGRPLLAAVTKRIGGADKVEQAEAYSRKWAGWGIFFSRWLIGPLGPWINVTSGLTEYPWVRFIILDVAGEVLWLLIYVSLGRAFTRLDGGRAEVGGAVLVAATPALHAEALAILENGTDRAQRMAVVGIPDPQPERPGLEGTVRRRGPDRTHFRTLRLSRQLSDFGRSFRYRTLPDVDIDLCIQMPQIRPRAQVRRAGSCARPSVSEARGDERL